MQQSYTVYRMLALGDVWSCGIVDDGKPEEFVRG